MSESSQLPTRSGLYWPDFCKTSFRTLAHLQQVYDFCLPALKSKLDSVGHGTVWRSLSLKDTGNIYLPFPISVCESQCILLMAFFFRSFQNKLFSSSLSNFTVLSSATAVSPNCRILVQEWRCRCLVKNGIVWPNMQTKVCFWLETRLSHVHF